MFKVGVTMFNDILMTFSKKNKFCAWLSCSKFYKAHNCCVNGMFKVLQITNMTNGEQMIDMFMTCPKFRK